MTRQLRLIDANDRPAWKLDEKTRRMGRRGVARARRALAQAHPPEPTGEPLRRAG